MNWIIEYKELVLTIGVSLFIGIRMISKKTNNALTNSAETHVSSPNTNTNTITINTANSSVPSQVNTLPSGNTKKFKSAVEAQNNLKILFIDDDTNFKVVNLLKTAGYKNTKILKDVKSLDSSEIINTDIFFIDIQGVGKKLAFKDEGLGLANALKEKYKDKIIVIYSAENRGDRFHNGLRKADDFLPKNADPYEFQQIIETFFVEE